MSRKICFIPARSGSTRIPNKNIRLLDGHPLMAYTIAVALDSKIFDKVYVVSNSNNYRLIAKDYGADVICEDSNKDWTKSRDFDWMKQALDEGYLGEDDDWMLLRPTSPFKTPETIKSAYWVYSMRIIEDIRKRTFREILTFSSAISVRAVKKTSCHPFKSWVIPNHEQMFPFIPRTFQGPPRYECQTQNLGDVWVQSATLEVGNASLLLMENLSGDRIYPYFCKNYEGVDINTEEDWLYCKFLIEKGLAKLPEVHRI